MKAILTIEVDIPNDQLKTIEAANDKMKMLLEEMLYDNSKGFKLVHKCNIQYEQSDESLYLDGQLQRIAVASNGIIERMVNNIKPGISIADFIYTAGGEPSQHLSQEEIELSMQQGVDPEIACMIIEMANFMKDQNHGD